MTFFEDKLAALGRALDRTAEWLTGTRSGAGVGAGPTLGERISGRFRAAGESIHRARHLWSVAPESEKRRTLTIAGATCGGVLAILLGVIFWLGTRPTIEQQRAISAGSDLQQKILDGQKDRGSAASLFPGAH